MSAHQGQLVITGSVPKVCSLCDGRVQIRKRGTFGWRRAFECMACKVAIVIAGEELRR